MNQHDKIPIYHLTHFGNLEKIMVSGALLAKNRLNSSYNDVSYGHIQNRRAKSPVQLAPYGGLHDYVPFYFCPRSPMLYAINKGTTSYQGGQTRMIYLVTNTYLLQQTKAQFVFTDRHAAVKGVRYFADLKELSQLKWDYIEAHYWNNNLLHPRRSEFKQAEFLVFGQVSWKDIEYIGVLNGAVGSAVKRVLERFPTAMRRKVFVKPDWYYD